MNPERKRPPSIEEAIGSMKGGVYYSSKPPPRPITEEELCAALDASSGAWVEMRKKARFRRRLAWWLVFVALCGWRREAVLTWCILVPVIAHILQWWGVFSE